MKTINLILVLVVIATMSSCTQNKKSSETSISHTPQEAIPEYSKLPQGHHWKLVWSDEFEGNALDTTKWDFRLHLLQTRHNTWTKDGASLDGKGNLLLKLYEKDGQYYSSALQTGENFLDRQGARYSETLNSWPVGKIKKPKFQHKYGYYEIRCQLPKQEGWWPAFWLQSPIIGSTLDPRFSGVELDIMEYFNREGRIRHAAIWGGYGPDSKHKSAGDQPQEGVEEGFHTFGVHWSTEGYVFYVDGRETWRFNEVVSDCEQFILVTTECVGYRNGGPSPLLKKAVLPDYFIVDYVRVFDEVK
jgi:beta-glucanase (GH16 family)